MMKMHIMNPRAVTAVKNPPCIESFASLVTTKIAAIKFKILEMTVKRPGVVFKYPKSNIFDFVSKELCVALFLYMSG